MNRRIAILRGINVGGKRIIRMVDLKSLFKDLGFNDIETYIQSGNIIFSSELKLSDMELSRMIEETISTNYGFSVPVIIRSADEIKQAIQNNPFYKVDEDISPLHLTFLKEQPTEENYLNATSYNYEPDKFALIHKDVYIFCKGKYHETKLTNSFFESKLKVATTTRNWRTVLKLMELIN